MSGLSEKTEYEFKLRAWTDEHEESATSDTVQATTFRAGKNSYLLSLFLKLLFSFLQKDVREKQDYFTMQGKMIVSTDSDSLILYNSF